MYLIFNRKLQTQAVTWFVKYFISDQKPIHTKWMWTLLQWARPATFVVTDITFKVAVITSSVSNITFVVAEITFEVVVIISSVVKITFVVV